MIPKSGSVPFYNIHNEMTNPSITGSTIIETAKQGVGERSFIIYLFLAAQPVFPLDPFLQPIIPDPIHV
jgi:hypothetical protein